jgi:hypothetical protein
MFLCVILKSIKLIFSFTEMGKDLKVCQAWEPLPIHRQMGDNK